MEEDQKVFWISRKTTARADGKIIGYGDEVTELFSPLDIAYHREEGEVGTIEVAQPEGVKMDKAFEEANDKLRKAVSMIGELKKDLSREKSESAAKADKARADALASCDKALAGKTAVIEGLEKSLDDHKAAIVEVCKLLKEPTISKNEKSDMLEILEGLE